MSEETETRNRKSPVNEELIGNLLSVNQWLRIVLMILYVFLGWVVRMLQYALVVIQTVIALFTGRENSRLARAGEIAALYQAQIWLFLSYATNERPFPFSDLPVDESSLDLGSTRSAGETYDAEPQPDTAEEQGKEGVSAAEETADTDTDPVSDMQDEPDQDDDEDDVFSDMSFSSAGKDFVNHGDDDKGSDDSSDDEEDDKKNA